ncbi:uncharacterized protein LOC123879040 isoform X2 [Maniola jurtina]|uniref:uncharacterized protein LOC123879040 isoform X2 n=1 Tax=Maniola jurtina TaxID=191418 RepID=UPI001E688546|nr:uncharacterized protein LOC123879040 isoform X2 [Maniola jurtina]
MAKVSVANPVKAAIAKKRKRKPKLNKNKSKNKITTVKPSAASVVKASLDSSDVEPKIENEIKVPSEDKKVTPSLSTEQFGERFPVFNDKELIKKFLGVNMTNNQKGRIRQTLRDSLKGTSDQLLPDVIHNRVQAIVKETTALTDANLRKIRILYNMLKTTVEAQPTDAKEKKNKKGKNKKKKDKGNESEKEVKSETEVKGKSEAEVKSETEVEVKSETEVEGEVTDEEMEDSKDIIKKEKEDDKMDTKIVKDKKQDKTKGPKRYVVFVGNLPLDIDKERITQHFKDFKDHIVDVRIPKPGPNKKTCIAYVELKNELCYELALSKHHTMLENKRINVHYTTQKNSKISKTEAKGKAAKLVALQKSGKLAGSIPLNRKRSQRRMKAKQAKAKLEAGV